MPKIRQWQAKRCRREVGVAVTIAVVCGLSHRLVSAQSGQPLRANRPEPDKQAPSSQPSAASAPASRPAVPSTQPATVSGPAAPTRDNAENQADPFSGLDHSGTPSPPSRLSTGGKGQPLADRRSLPNYDGRVSEALTVGDVLIWVPRAVLYPVHLLLEYGLRWPMVKLVTVAEEHYVFNRIKRFFTFADGKAGLYPTAFFDAGRGLWGGANFFYNGLGISNHSLIINAGYGSSGWYSVAARDTVRVFRNKGGLITLSGGYSSAPNLAFTGLGPDTDEEDQGFFGLRLAEVDLSLSASLSGLNQVQFGVGYRNAKIEEGRDPEAPPADVPGFGDAYDLLRIYLNLVADTRSPDRVWTPGTGLRLELFGSFQFDPSATDLNFFRWGGEAAGFLDLSGINHVIALRVYAEALESTGDALVPASELIALGGQRYLRGFLQGRFRGESALVVTTSYRYPVWAFLDADIFASVGNVFGQRWERLHVKRMTLNWGIGLRTNTSRAYSIGIMLAFGTNQFERWDDDGGGFHIDRVRFMAGANHGF